MITTTLDKMVDFWRRHGVEAEELYKADGIVSWGIEVEQDNPLLGNPEYIGLMIQERMRFPIIVSKRMQPPLFVPKVNGHVAVVPRKSGSRVIPIARDKELLRFALTDPCSRARPAISKVKSSAQVQKVLRKALKDRVDGLLYFVSRKHTESIPTDVALEYTWVH